MASDQVGKVDVVEEKGDISHTLGTFASRKPRWADIDRLRDAASKGA